MNNHFQRRAILFVGILFLTLTVNASPISNKNIYVQIEAIPSGAGEVYVTSKSDDKKYIKEAASWGEKTSMKATLLQNGEDPDGSGMYEAIVDARPADGYEFLCYSYETEAFGDIFLVQDIYQEASTTDSAPDNGLRHFCQWVSTEQEPSSM